MKMFDCIALSITGLLVASAGYADVPLPEVAQGEVVSLSDSQLSEVKGKTITVMAGTHWRDPLVVAPNSQVDKIIAPQLMRKRLLIHKKHRYLTELAME